MRSITSAMVLAALAGFVAPAAQASSVCIQSHLIDHTSVVDTKAILFHMIGGKVWRNTLISPCPGLKLDGYVLKLSGGDEICSNMQTIRILRSHEVCMLGAFTPEPPAAPHA